MSCQRPSGLSDKELLLHLKRLIRKERSTTFEVLITLCEIERRKLHFRLGFSSMFEYCTEHLKYSASVAGRRIQVARCISRFPEIGRLLKTGEVNLTTVSLVASFLSTDNISELLPQISGKTQRDVEKIAARYKPPLRLRDSVKPVRVAVTTTPESRGDKERTNTEIHSRNGSETPPASATSKKKQASSTSTPGTGVAGNETPTEQKLLIQFLADDAFLAKFEKVRSLLSNKSGTASFKAVFDATLDEFIDRHAPENKVKRRLKRRPENSKPRATKSPQIELKKRGDSRRIPQAVRDKVYVRDDGQCTYVGASGRRCRTTKGLQIDHVKPYALGGSNAASNLRLLCGVHNRLEAERVMGTCATNRYRRRE